MQIELTQYGKHLLSKGVFNPSYYAFFDDNILYDSEFAGFSEHQNEVNNRVIKDTPQLEGQYIFDSVEEQVRKVNKYIREKDEEFHTYGRLAELGSEATISQAAKFHSMAAPLGTSALDKIYAPSWSIEVLHGQISGTVNLLTGSYQNSFIPQLTPYPITYKYKIIKGEALPANETRTKDEGELNLVDDEAGPNITAVDQFAPPGGLGDGEFIDQFDDGNYLAIYDDSLILQVEEKNTADNKENFDIEVYMVSTEKSTKKIGSDKEILVPLYFSKTPELIRNDILLDLDELPEVTQVSENDSTYVDYFFNIYVDKEIDQKMLVQVLDKDEAARTDKEGRKSEVRVGEESAADLYKPVNDETETTKTEDECD